MGEKKPVFSDFNLQKVKQEKIQKKTIKNAGNKKEAISIYFETASYFLVKEKA